MLEDTDPVGEEPIQEDAPKPAAPAPDAGELQRQLDHERTQRQTAERDRDVWYNRATQQQPKELAAPTPVVEPEDDEDFDYLDATVNSKGRDIDSRIEKRAAKIAKQIVADTLKAGGFVSAKEAQQIAAQQAEDIRESAQLVQEYPDLQVKGSPLQAETERHLQAIENHPAYSSMPPLQQVRIAAERAQNELYRTGRMANAPPPDPNAERQQRIRAQQGNFTNYNAPVQERESELTPGEKQMAKIFGVSEKAYTTSKNTHRYRR